MTCSPKITVVPTLKAIALHTGMSIPTVSQVLGNKGRLYSDETRRRIIHVANELGYRPNGAAKAVSTGRFGCLALLVSTKPHFSYLPGELLDSICSAAEEHDYHLSLAKLPDEKLTSEGYIPKILRQWMADGLLIDYINEIPQRMQALIRQYHIPSIWINSKQPTDAAHPDDFGAGRKVTEHLLKLGHRSVAFLSYTISQHYSTVDRLGGYAAAMQAAGLSPRNISAQKDLSPQESLVFSGQWLRETDRPSAVVAYSSFAALATLRAAERLGLRVPEDLSVTTFADAACTDFGLSVSTMIVPQKQLGHTVVEMLLQKMKAPQHDLPACAVPFDWADGQSCGPAAAKH